MRWREALAADIEPCLGQQPSAWGDEIVGRARALAIWKDLLGRDMLIAGVIERTTGGGRCPVLGFGASVFVTTDFVNAETHHPRPNINSRIIASVAAGRSVILDRKQVARANAGTGLDAVFLAAVWWKTSNAIEFSEMMMASSCSCVEAHAGYRMRSVMVELSGQQGRSLGDASAAFDVVAEFPDVDRVLLRQRKERAAEVATNASNLLFQYHEPRLLFRHPDQQLLIAALKGATDHELSAELEINVPTVKKRWRSIFMKVEDHMPDLFAHLAPVDGKRGPQRRHLVLSYVREHPEELRPFARA